MDDRFLVRMSAGLFVLAVDVSEVNNSGGLSLPAQMKEPSQTAPESSETVWSLVRKAWCGSMAEHEHHSMGAAQTLGREWWSG